MLNLSSCFVAYINNWDNKVFKCSRGYWNWNLPSPLFFFFFAACACDSWSKT